MSSEHLGAPGVTIHEPAAEAGYTLYNGRQLEEAKLLDVHGNVVHRWAYPQGLSWHYADLTDGGNLGAVVKEVEDRVAGMFLELDWEGGLLRQVEVPAHHDFERLENGNTIVLCREYVEETIAYEGEAKSDYYVELAPDGEAVWEWHAHEHVDEIADLVDLAFPKDRRDWAHTNTVESLPATPLGREDERFREGNVLFSMRSIDTVGVIEKGTGEVVWAWGPGELEGQHIPTMLADGTILIFDNGMSGLHADDSREHSRVLEVDPRTDEIAWEYVADPPDEFCSASRGCSQRLPGGNTLVTESNTGRLFEITRGGDLVWEWKNPDLTADGDRMPIYRAMRYAPERIEPLL